jgi:integrase
MPTRLPPCVAGMRACPRAQPWPSTWAGAGQQAFPRGVSSETSAGWCASELVGAVLRDIRADEHGESWLHVIGKGSKPGRVALPPLATDALDQYLLERHLPVSRERWNPATPILAGLGEHEGAGITGAHLWRVMRRFFLEAAGVLEGDHPLLAEKLHRASPHWMRHSHASHALARGAELTSVRDNLRHSSISTTSMYLCGDDLKRSRQFTEAFGRRIRKQRTPSDLQ